MYCLFLYDEISISQLQSQTDLSSCPSDVECKHLPFPCIKCSFDYSCIYGKEQIVTCNANTNVACNVSKNLSFVHLICRKQCDISLQFDLIFLYDMWPWLCVHYYILQGQKEFQRSMICRYCWQTEHWEHSCVLKDSCNSANQFYM